MRGRKLSIPLKRRTFNRLLSPEQIAITAAHAANSIPDQTNDLRAVRRCQPLVARLVADERVEQRGGNLAVACASLPPVQRAEHEDQPSPLLCGERRDRRWRRSDQALPEMQYGFDALRQMCVKGDNGRKWRGRRGVSKHPKLAVAAMLAQQRMTTVRPVDGK